MTGYIPTGTQWRDVDDGIKLTIAPVISTNQNITLRGSLVGDASGTFDNPQMITHGGGNAMSGICGILNQITESTTSSIASGATYAIAMKYATVMVSQSTSSLMASSATLLCIIM